MVVTLPLDSFHTAHLDVASGRGLLACPTAGTDVWIGHESIHGHAWLEVTGRLASLGWWPSREPDGSLRCVGRTGDGRLVVETRSIRGHDHPDAKSWDALCAAAGLTPGAQRSEA